MSAAGKATEDGGEDNEIEAIGRQPEWMGELNMTVERGAALFAGVRQVIEHTLLVTQSEFDTRLVPQRPSAVGSLRSCGSRIGIRGATPPPRG